MASRHIIIAGATASGKSALALELAQEIDGEIINVDSMQVYEPIPIISSQPSSGDKLQVPHHLYGYVKADTSYSVAKFIADVTNIITKLQAQGKPAILVGGTGLYIKSLIHGLSYVPAIDPGLRQEVRGIFEQLGNNQFHLLLKQFDQLTADKISQTDSQRMIRAMEVVRQTGRSIYSWQQQERSSNFDFQLFVLDIERDVLNSNINQRFQQMVANGAIEEVCKFRELQIAADLPVNKAIGIKEISNYLAGNISLAQAIELAQIATRQYAKRQRTWFRHQLAEAVKLPEARLELITRN